MAGCKYANVTMIEEAEEEDGMPVTVDDADEEAEVDDLA